MIYQVELPHDERICEAFVGSPGLCVDMGRVILG